MKGILAIFSLTFILISCSLFETRTPQEPDQTNQNFPPAVSPQILIDNFIKAFNQKNIVAYTNCFSEVPKYQFIPSADALNIYPGIFDDWEIEDEKSFANNLFNKFLQETNPNLVLSNPSYSSPNPDSTLFLSGYQCEINSTENAINQIYSGRLQFTLVKNQKGTWAISRWIDLKSGAKEIPSISILKAKLKV